jgi:hypothetical protein
MCVNVCVCMCVELRQLGGTSIEQNPAVSTLNPRLNASLQYGRDVKNIDTLYTSSRLRIIQKSQLAKNRNLSRLMSNLSRLNWSSERNCLYCLSALFTLLLQQEVQVRVEVLVYPVIFPVQFLSTAIRY